jgi:hypothetical protein
VCERRISSGTFSLGNLQPLPVTSLRPRALGHASVVLCRAVKMILLTSLKTLGVVIASFRIAVADA